MRKAISFILTLALLMTMVMGTPIVACAGDENVPDLPAHGSGGCSGVVYVNGIEMVLGQYLQSNNSTEVTECTTEEALDNLAGTYVPPNDYVAWYDGETLYLSGASITNGYSVGYGFGNYAGIFSQTGDLTIELNGHNTIGPVDSAEIEDETRLLDAIYVCGDIQQEEAADLTITGSGTLYVKGGSKLEGRDSSGGNGISCAGDLTVADSCILSVEAAEDAAYVINASGNIYIDNEDNPFMESEGSGNALTPADCLGAIVFKHGKVYTSIKVNGFDMSDGDYLSSSDETGISGNAQTTSPSSYVAWYLDGILHLKDADFTDDDPLIESKGNLKIALAGSNSLTNTDDSGNAIRVDGDLSVSGTGGLTVKALKTGMYAKNKISISESVELNFICSTGLHAGGDLDISGGNITVTATNTAILIGGNEYGSFSNSAQGTLHMTGGTLSVTSAGLNGSAAMMLVYKFDKGTAGRLSQVATAGGTYISKTGLSEAGFAFVNEEYSYYIGDDKVTYMLFNGASVPPTPPTPPTPSGDYELKVNGIEMSDGEYLSDTEATTPTDAGESTPSAFAVWYKDGTLYLRDAQFNSNDSLIERDGDLNIALVGDNLLTCTGSDEAIDVDGNLTFISAEDPATGSDRVGLGWEGSLTVFSPATGIETDGNLNISSGAVNVRGGDCAVEIGEGIAPGPTLHMSGGMLSVLATKATGAAMKLKDNYILSDDVKPVQAATSGGVIISGSALGLEKIKYSNKDGDAVCYGSTLPLQTLTYMLFVELPNPQTSIEPGSFCWLTKSQEYTIAQKTTPSKFMCIRLDCRDFASNSNRIYDNISFQFLSYSFGDNGKATFYAADEGMYIFMIIPKDR